MKKIFTMMVVLAASIASAFAEVWTPQYNDQKEATVPFSALKASDGITIEQESDGSVKVTSDGSNGKLAIELPDEGIDISDGVVVTFTGNGDIFTNLSLASKDYGDLGGLWSSKYVYNGKGDKNRIGKLRHVNKMEWCGNTTGGTMTISSIVIKKLADEFQLGADEVNLTASMFRDWTHWDNRIDAGALGCSYAVGTTVKDGDTVYGSSGVEGKNFADLTGYKELRIYATAGKTFRILFNRPVDGGGSAAITEEKITTNDNGVATLELTSYDYVHLNAIKVAYANNGNFTVNAIALLYDDDPYWDEASYWNPINKANRQPYIKRTLKAGLNTICLPIAVPDWTFQYTFGSANKDAVAYEFKGVEGSKLLFEKVKDIQAGVPYLLDLKADCTIGKVGQAVDITVEEPKAVTINGVTFQGTFNLKTLATDGTNLFLASGEKLAKPSTEEGANQLKGMRGYFVLPEAETQTYSLAFGGGETTGINAIAGEQNAKIQGVYTLTGVKIANSTANLAKGVYLVNGKKFIKK